MFITYVRDTTPNKTGVPHIPKTARGWELYCALPESEDAARRLGEILEGLLTEACKSGACNMSEARRIRNLMFAEMDRYVHLGALDTEPVVVLTKTIEIALGLSETLRRFD